MKPFRRKEKILPLRKILITFFAYFHFKIIYKYIYYKLKKKFKNCNDQINYFTELMPKHLFLYEAIIKSRITRTVSHQKLK